MPESEHHSRLLLAGRLSHSLLHELATPLQAVLSNTEAARRALGGEQPPDVAMLRELIDDLYDSGVRASDTVTYLRAFLADNDVHREPLDLNRAIAEAARFLQSELIRCRTTIDAQLESRLPPVPSDRAQIEHLILSLLLDTTRITAALAREDRRVRLRTRLTGGRIQIVVDIGVSQHAEDCAQTTERAPEASVRTNVPVNTRDWLRQVLAMADHHAAAGERHLERQRSTLEKCRQKNLDVALATDLLHTLEWSQRQPIERRDYLRRQLAAAL